MYSDIIPPKKNQISKTRIVKEKDPVFSKREIYHTIDGKDRGSKIPVILFFITIIILAIIYYSLFNNKTYISFESKSTILEIRDKIDMSLSEDNANSSTTLSYNLIYKNDGDRNIFADDTQTQIVATSTSIDKKVETVDKYNTLISTSTNSIKKVIFINETNSNIKVIKTTRVEVGDIIYNLDEEVNLKPTAKDDLKEISSTTLKYKVLGFKGTSKYDKFYAIDFVDNSIDNDNKDVIDSSTNNATIPNQDILSLIPDEFIPLQKNYIFDKTLNQHALIVINKKDFEKVLNNNSKLIQEYIKNFKSISDFVKYKININDYDLELSNENGKPIAFKNLTIEITPEIEKDKVAKAFTGFSKDTMKKIKYDIQKFIILDISFSPFWMNKVSDIDHINVEVK